MQLDLNSIVHGRNSVDHSINTVYQYSELQKMLQKYDNVLNKQLGHCTKVQAHIQLKSSATPKFFKPRSIPFAYLDRVKEEIQRLVEAGILERIDTSLWAAPIVPAKKQTVKFEFVATSR